MTVASIDSVTQEFSRSIHDAYAARKFTRNRLRYWKRGEFTDVIGQVVSELAANAAQYGTGPFIAIRLESRNGILVSVWDGNSRQFPRVREPDLEGESGRGLVIVSALSKRWGWYPDDTERGGKWVWAEVVSGE